MSDSNRVAFRAVREVTPGATPATPKFRALRVTRPRLSFAPKSVVSAELRADRRTSDSARVGMETGGGYDFELSARSHDDTFEAALCSTWIRTPEKDNGRVAGNITAVAATTYTTTATGGAPVQGSVIKASGFANAANNKVFVAGAATSSTSVVHAGGVAEASPPATARLKVVGFQGTAGDIKATTGGSNTLTATAADFVALGFLAGMWIRVGVAAGDAFSFATAGSNGWVRISSVAAKTLSLDVVPAGWGADAGATKTIRLSLPDVIREGTTVVTDTLEREFGDIGVFQYLPGAQVNTLSLNLQAEQIVTGAVEYMGRGLPAIGNVRFTGATTVAPPTTPVITTGSNVGRIAEGGVPITGPNYVTRVSVSLGNNLARRPAIGYDYAPDMRTGESAAEGTMETYFGSSALYAKLLADEETSISVQLGDVYGDGYTIDMPRVKLSDGDIETAGKNGDNMFNPKFRALAHPTLGYQLHLQRNEAIGVAGV